MARRLCSRSACRGPRCRRAASGREPAGHGGGVPARQGRVAGRLRRRHSGRARGRGRRGGVSPEMPWSLRRMYGATFDAGDDARSTPRSRASRRKGATRIVIIGHSLGANAAIGYAGAPQRGRRGGGDRARAPAGDRGNARPHPTTRSPRRARLWRPAEQEQRTWPDLVQGVPDLRVGDAGGLSQHVRSGRAGGDPEERRGVARHSVPVGGRQLRSRSTRAAATTPLRARAKNPASRYIEVSAGHLTTSLAARRPGRRMAEIIVARGERRRRSRLHEFR